MKEQKHVGADTSVYSQSQKEYLKFGRRDFRRKCRMTMSEAKGITLIALIITIIILLILAMVSIKLIWDGGIITHAQTATSKYTIEQEKELIGLGYSNYKMAKINDNSASLTVEGAQVDGTGPWTIIFNETGNRYNLNENGEIDGPTPKTEDEATLEKYFLGENGEGIELFSILNGEDRSFMDNDTMPEANSQITFLDAINYDANTIYVYAKYNNAAYRVVTGYSNDSYPTKSVSLVYTPDTEGKEGTKVIYSYDGTKEHEEEWTILYNNGDNIEIVSPNTMGSLTLGYDDEQAQGDSNLEKAIYSYNNAVARINKYCSDLITNTNKLAVRSVGSNPNNPSSENTTMYTSENLAKWNAAYNGRGKSRDTNLEQDIVRMSYWGVNKSEDENDYWLASRRVNEDSGSVTFSVRNVYSGGSADSYRNLWYVPSSGSAYYFRNGCSARPVVKINS